MKSGGNFKADINTTVVLDGKVVGQVMTPYVNNNLSDIESLSERGV